MTRLLLILTSVVAAFGAGCGTSPTATDGIADSSGRSFAAEVARAGGLTIYDVPKARVRMSPGAKNATLPPAALASASASGWLAPPPGISPGAMTGIFTTVAAVSFLTTPESQFNRLLVWMPASGVNTPEEAKEELRRVLRDALSRAYPERTVADHHIADTLISFTLDGPGCDPECRWGVAEIQSPQRVTAPAFAGGGSAWSWPNTKLARRAVWLHPALPRLRRAMGMINSLEFYQRLSSELPDWAYIYLAPAKDLIPMPVILHRGEAHLFVRGQ